MQWGSLTSSGYHGIAWFSLSWVRVSFSLEIHWFSMHSTPHGGDPTVGMELEG